MDAEAEQVREYYNDFLSRRMMAYRLHGNIRIDAAQRFFSSYATESSTILDIGCGIGIVSEALGKKARRGLVIGVDISDRNIWYARQTVKLAHVQFHSLDVVRQASEIVPLLRGKAVDLFVLADVVEHIPEKQRPQLFQAISSLASPDAKILITIPSEYYQRFLMREMPEELQIIDNVITPGLLDEEGATAGFSLTYFRMIDMWKGAQYAHCVLERRSALERRVTTTVAQPRHVLLDAGRRVFDKLYRRPRLRRRYVTDVFPEA